MTPLLFELAKQAVLSKNWIWEPGMRVIGPGGRVGTTTGFKTLRYRSYVDVAWDDGQTVQVKTDDLVPLAISPTTCALVLAMTRMALENYSVHPWEENGRWRISLPGLSVYENPVEGESEAEVIFRAFLATPLGADALEDEDWAEPVGGQTSEVPFDLSSVDPGIQDVVEALRREGFRTTDSGDGYSKAEVMDILDFPHVFSVCPARSLVSESERLLAWLKSTPIIQNRRDWHVEASLNPEDSIGILMLIGPAPEGAP